MEGLLRGVLDIALDALKGDDKPEKKNEQQSGGSSADRGQSWSEVPLQPSSILKSMLDFLKSIMLCSRVQASQLAVEFL